MRRVREKEGRGEILVEIRGGRLGKKHSVSR